jgi:predicted nicotinamide N-methyase
LAGRRARVEKPWLFEDLAHNPTRESEAEADFLTRARRGITVLVGDPRRSYLPQTA